MIKEAIGTGETLPEAQKAAVEQLHAPFEAEVKIEVISAPKKKTLGLFGGAPARVRAYYDDGKKEAPQQPKKEAAKEPVKADAPKAPAAPAREKKPEAPKQAKAPAPKKEAPTEKAPASEGEDSLGTPDLSGIEAKETPATAYLQSILVGMGTADAHVTVKEMDDALYFEIESNEDFGNIIGRRGETLDALQYLTRLFVNRSDHGGKRVSLNVGDYRKRREETLRGLAQHQASRAIKYGRNAVLEPMSPYERRVIHTTVQGIEGVSSHSVGEGDGRRVVITPDGGEHRDFDHSNDHGNDHGGYRRGGSGHGGPRERRAPYVPENSGEPREPKVDVAASFRYGKVAPKAAPAAAESAPPVKSEEKTEE